MSRIAYVNGRYVPHHAASVHIEDRGYQYADAVYEVCEVVGGGLVDAKRHLDRLERSLAELRIRAPMSRAALLCVLHETVARNRVRDGFVYLQVSRGVARRDHFLPHPSLPPSVVVTARSTDRAAAERVAQKGIAVVTVPDNRWGRPDIKTVQLLPNTLAKQTAREAGASEAWFVDRDGYVTEGGSTNAWIVTRDGRLVTRQADTAILRGVTRTGVLDLVRRRNLAVEERPFSVEEARAAAEAFVTSASNPVTPVVRIDGHPIGDGAPGPVALALRAAFREVTDVSWPFNHNA